MIDIKHLRKTHSVLLVREYLAMHGLNESTESLTGRWEPESYHIGATKLRAKKGRLSLFTVPNEDYDPPEFVLVDSLPVSSSPPSPASLNISPDGISINRERDSLLMMPSARKLAEMLQKKSYNYGPTLTYDEARAAIAPSSDEQTFEQLLS